MTQPTALAAARARDRLYVVTQTVSRLDTGALLRPKRYTSRDEQWRTIPAPGPTEEGKERKMPIHLDDVDIASEIAGSRSALIVPCNMCPAVTVAVKKKEPFIQLLKSFLKSVPFEQHIRALQSRLKEEGVRTEVFRSRLPHQWFMCMWTSGRRRKLQSHATKHDAVIVLGCDSATETVRDSVRSAQCTVVQGMQVAGVMNATLSLDLLGNVSFQGCKIVPLSLKKKQDDLH